ncbi:succinate dehydrogenase assembly factor 2 [Lutibaculum baratangense]|nr:succinate dehydrogenase assembly factor 2 [Lutibaculum baratangense]
MPSTDDLDLVRRRLLYRCWHRGTREMDLLLGRYAEVYIAGMDEAQLGDLETLMEVDEKELFAWLTETKPMPDGAEGELVRSIRRFHAEHPVAQD